jgi:hypothetical protein
VCQERLWLGRAGAAQRDTKAFSLGGCQLVVSRPASKTLAGLEASLTDQALDHVPGSAPVEEQVGEDRPKSDTIQAGVSQDAAISFEVLVHYQSSYPRPADSQYRWNPSSLSVE